MKTTSFLGYPYNDIWKQYFPDIFSVGWAIGHKTDSVYGNTMGILWEIYGKTCMDGLVWPGLAAGCLAGLVCLRRCNATKCTHRPGTGTLLQVMTARSAMTYQRKCIRSKDAVPIHCKHINGQITSTCCAIVAKSFGARRGLYGNGSNITSIRK